MMELLPSVASAEQINLGAAIDSLGEWPYLHIDMEDGNFVPNITFGMKTVKAICGHAEGKRVDVHMMATNPVQYLEGLAECGVAMACAHIEALEYPLLFLEEAKRLGMEAGLALNFKTPIEAFEPFSDAADYLLVMTSEPDGRGQLLSDYAVQKAIRAAKRYPRVYTDGGIDENTLQRLAEGNLCGAVLGRLAFSCDSPDKKLNALAARFK
jgi:ribulose-phosphate 3-epimerase